jgi:serine/threonine-protein kinase RsbW
MRVAPSKECREWSVRSDVQAIAPIVETVQVLAAQHQFAPAHCRVNIPVALTEAIANAMLQGNGGDSERWVHVRVTVEPQALVMEITDEGAGLPPTLSLPTPDDADWLEREDGRGMFLMRSLVDLLESVPGPGDRGHTLRLTLRRP